MTSKNKILLVIIGILLLAIAAYWAYGGIAFKEKNSPIENATTTVGSEPVQQILSNRDLAIQDALTKPDTLPKVQINGETYLLTGYDDTFWGYEQNSHGPKENSPGRPFGGILVFKRENGKPTLFWESDEYISRLFVSFRDMDNDGIPEIVFDGGIGADGRDNALYVYRFVGDTFKLITPIKVYETTIFATKFKYGMTLLGGSSELTYIKDINNDGIQEIIVGSDQGNDTKDMKIYKFNGSEYYLWKETTEPYTAPNP